MKRFFERRSLWLCLSSVPRKGLGKSIPSITVESISLSVTQLKWLELSHKPMNNLHWLPAPLRHLSESLMNSRGWGDRLATSAALLTSLQKTAKPWVTVRIRDVNFILGKIDARQTKKVAEWVTLPSLFSKIEGFKYTSILHKMMRIGIDESLINCFYNKNNIPPTSQMCCTQIFKIH